MPPWPLCSELCCLLVVVVRLSSIRWYGLNVGLRGPKKQVALFDSDQTLSRGQDDGPGAVMRRKMRSELREVRKR